KGRVVGGMTGDWFLVGPDGTGTIDFRGTLETDDGATIYMYGMGRCDMRGGVGNAGVLYGAPLFETGDERYAWLNQMQGIFAAVMGAAGVGDGTHVVAYDLGAGMWATRLWWMLRVFGFDAVSVLDGGFRAWTAGGHPVSTDPTAYPQCHFEPHYRPELVASAAEVAAQVASARGWLVNALSPEVFRGDPAPGYKRGGRIPGSVNVPYYTLLDSETGRFLSPDRIGEQFAAAGVTEANGPVATYCGSGFAATAVA